MENSLTQDFDYGASAELFALKRKKYGPVTYRRFDTAAEAIRYAIESLSSNLLGGTFIETGADRLDGRTIQQLYAGPRYPLKRCHSDVVSVKSVHRFPTHG